MARLGPSVMSAIRSLWDGKATLRKPYAISSIYEYAPLAHPSLNFRRPTLNFQHPPRMLRLQLLPERATLPAVEALHPLIPGVPASNGGITLIRRV
jgi:hypothetical protein